MRGYKVGYIASDDLYEQDVQIVKSTNQYLTIENLKKYTNYTIWVLAFTKVGDGIKTKQFYCPTHEDGKFERNTFSFTTRIHSLIAFHKF